MAVASSENEASKKLCLGSLHQLIETTPTEKLSSPSAVAHFCLKMQQLIKLGDLSLMDMSIDELIPQKLPLLIEALKIRNFSAIDIIFMNSIGIIKEENCLEILETCKLDLLSLHLDADWVADTIAKARQRVSKIFSASKYKDEQQKMYRKVWHASQGTSHIVKNEALDELKPIFLEYWQARKISKAYEIPQISSLTSWLDTCMTLLEKECARRSDNYNFPVCIEIVRVYFYMQHKLKEAKSNKDKVVRAIPKAMRGSAANSLATGIESIENILGKLQRIIFNTILFTRYEHYFPNNIKILDYERSDPKFYAKVNKSYFQWIEEQAKGMRRDITLHVQTALAELGVQNLEFSCWHYNQLLDKIDQTIAITKSRIFSGEIFPHPAFEALCILEDIVKNGSFDYINQVTTQYRMDTLRKFNIDFILGISLLDLDQHPKFKRSLCCLEKAGKLEHPSWQKMHEADEITRKRLEKGREQKAREEAQQCRLQQAAEEARQASAAEEQKKAMERTSALKKQWLGALNPKSDKKQISQLLNILNGTLTEMKSQDFLKLIVKLHLPGTGDLNPDMQGNYSLVSNKLTITAGGFQSFTIHLRHGKDRADYVDNAAIPELKAILEAVGITKMDVELLLEAEASSEASPSAAAGGQASASSRDEDPSTTAKPR